MPKKLTAAQERALAFEWLEGGDTGMSSEVIWHVMMKETVHRKFVPLDPPDFGRCYRLLIRIPTWKARLGEVAEQFPEWKPLIDHWDELTELYEQTLHTGEGRPLYDRMQQLRGRD